MKDSYIYTIICLLTVPRSSRAGKPIESQSWNKGGPWPGGKYFLVRPSHSVHECIILRLSLQLQSRNSNLLISLSTLTVQRKWLNVTLHGRRVTVSCPAVLRGSYWTDCNDYQYSGTLKNIHRYFSFSIYFGIYIDISHFQALSCTLVQSRSQSPNSFDKCLLPKKRVIETLGTILRLTLHSG